MPKIIPVEALKDASDLSEMCRETGEPVYITKNGYGDMVLMSIEMYEQLTGGKNTESAIDKAIEDAVSADDSDTDAGNADDTIAFLESMAKFGL